MFEIHSLLYQNKWFELKQQRYNFEIFNQETEQFAVVQEDGLVSHMLEEDASTTLAMKTHAVQMPTAKIRMEMPFVPAGNF